jgi:uncharacterized coiled-coil protein SlyX
MNALRQDRSEHTVEQRLARLETHVDHILRYLVELKADTKAALERLEAKFDKLTERVDRLEAKYAEKFDKMDARLTRIIYWALGLYIASMTTLLGVMARGFHWL